jgi:hypothetical protein
MKTYRLQAFTGGLANREPLRALSPNFLRTATNFFVDGSGRLKARPETKLQTTGAETLNNQNGIYRLGKRLTKMFLQGKSSGYLWYNSSGGIGGTWAATSTNPLGTGYKWDYLNLNNWVYIASLNALQRWAGGSDLYAAGLPVPNNTDQLNRITLASSATSGDLEEKTYYYRFAFSYGDGGDLGRGFYNNAVTKSATVSAGQTSIDLTFASNFNMPSDAHAVHVWRTTGDGSSLGPYYYLDSESSANLGSSSVTMNDGLADYLLGAQQQKDEEGIPPACRWIAHHQYRLWFGWTYEDSTHYRNRLYFSEVEEPDHVPLDQSD